MIEASDDGPTQEQLERWAARGLIPGHFAYPTYKLPRQALVIETTTVTKPPLVDRLALTLAEKAGQRSEWEGYRAEARDLIASVDRHARATPSAPEEDHAMTEAMTLGDAISHIRGLSLSVEGEFCVGKGECDALEAETQAALVALGVTQAELND